MTSAHLPPKTIRVPEPTSTPCPRCGERRVLIGHPARWKCPVGH